jgi:nicotinamide mononucleotide (NMN) deamidase PncC
MAHGIRACLKADFPMEDTIGISVSGIAGPGGSTPGKPVGLVWIGLSSREGAMPGGLSGKGIVFRIKRVPPRQRYNFCWTT